ncbi:MAG: flagellar hook assembly protein FlgD [Verrucomicrobia bacterium]|nr:MAG: flagellar hook assembly protein FlgD [Verrucomicrobiota bacterium]
MSTVAPIQATAADPVTAASVRTPKQVLGQEDFLKLLAVQFSSQDPLKPMEDTDFIAQMANFSSLEIQNSMAASLSSLSSSQQLSAAQMILGKQVDILDPVDGKVSGQVSAVWIDGNKTMLTVKGQNYDFDSISRIEMNNPEA